MAGLFIRQLRIEDSIGERVRERERSNEVITGNLPKRRCKERTIEEKTEVPLSLLCGRVEVVKSLGE